LTSRIYNKLPSYSVKKMEEDYKRNQYFKKLMIKKFYLLIFIEENLGYHHVLEHFYNFS